MPSWDTFASGTFLGGPCQLDQVKNLHPKVQLGVVGEGWAEGYQAATQPSDSTSACSRTVSVAFSCLSGWVAVLAEDAPDKYAKLGADILPQRPVYGDVSSHSLD